MKNYLLCFLLILLVLPTISFGAEMRTLEIDFSFTAPVDQEKQLLGYRLYKDGEQICATTEPNVSRMDCALLAEEGTFNFTLTAYYSNDTESPQSAPFPFTIDPVEISPPDEQGSITFEAEMRNLDIDFSFTAPADPAKQLLGYRLYKEGERVCATTEPNASRMDCAILTGEGTYDFTLTAYYSDDTESPASASFPFSISSTQNIDFNWEYADSAANAGGFRIYDNGVLRYETSDSSARQLAYTSDFSSPTHVFTIAAIDTNGQETSLPNSLTYSVNNAPTAVLSSSATTGNSPLSVTFDGSASTTPIPSIVSYTWTFGDGSQATGETASHVFMTPGTYYTELTIENSKGLTDKVTTPIIVSEPVAINEKPTAVISVDLTKGNVPLTVSFDGSQSFDPDGSIVMYSWDFGDGTTGSGEAIKHTYPNLGLYTVTLQVTDDKGETSTATKEIDCTLPLPNIEMGEVTIDHEWVKVLFEHTFNEPVVVAGPPTFNGSHQVLVRVRNVDQEGFEIRLQEWDYLDGVHIQETFSYIVMEKGVFTLDNGTKIEAGNFTGSSQFSKISLQQTYNLTPVILTQVKTENETDAVNGRVKKTNQSSFEYKLQEQETTSTSHGAETIGYIAWELGKGELSGLKYEAGFAKANSNWSNLTFQTVFPDMPFFIAGMQTSNGGDTAAVRMQNMSKTAVKLNIEEEQSMDSEVGHTTEDVGYLAIGSATE
jgi:PKD repeat protein